MALKGKPSLLFGAGGIGEGRISHTWTTPEQTSELLCQLLTLQPKPLTRLDSAGSYPPGSPWVTETLLGQSQTRESSPSLEKFKIDTKVIVTRTDPLISGSGHLALDKPKASLEKSLKLLGVKQVGVLYAHLYDPLTPIAEVARGFDDALKTGMCEEIGLCNFNTSQMTSYIKACEEYGYAKPTVYQGHYNAICRFPEESLYPFLRKHGIRIVAYGPLAGGFLTGKVTKQNADLKGGRWHPGNFPIYTKTYDKPSVHQAMLKFIEACENQDLTSTEASLRWLIYHSDLGEGDGVILGASRLDQLQSNVQICENGPLPAEVLQAIETLWEDVKGEVDDFTD